MTPKQFCYWLQGFAEVNQDGFEPTYEQWLIIKNHLATVFHKVTPEVKPVYAPNPLPRIEPSLVPMMEPPMDYSRYMPNPSLPDRIYNPVKTNIIC